MKKMKVKKLRGISRARKIATYLMNRGACKMTDARVEKLIDTNLNHAAPDVARTTLALLRSASRGSQLSRSREGVWSYTPPPAIRSR